MNATSYFTEVLSLKNVEANTPFIELLDSLQIINMIIYFESEHQILINTENLTASTTVRELDHIIDKAFGA